MTTFKEEFLGCRFRRDKLERIPQTERTTEVACCLQRKPFTADMCKFKADAIALSMERETSPTALRKSAEPAVVTAGSTHYRDSAEGVLMKITQMLDKLHPAIVLSVLTALQPQISELEACVSALKQESPCVAPSASELDPSEVATAVSLALSSRFTELADHTAAAVAAASARSRNEESDTSRQELAGALVKDLLPLMSGHLERSIDVALRPRLLELELSEARLKQLRSVGGDERSEDCKHPSQLLRRQIRGLSYASSISTLGRVKRNTKRSRNNLPSRAFVVNFRRLVQVQKILALIHEFIQSTAIATLTLVAAANASQLLFSILFVTLVLAMFAVHEMRYDGMDIEDYKSLVDLLEDDNGKSHGVIVENPNRLLKGLSLSHNRKRRGRAFITVFCAILVVSLVWINIFWSWANPPDEDSVLGFFDEHDRTVQATLLLVGTAMVLFHISFEWLYWRETQCVMPTMPGDRGQRSWDPRATADGVPRQYLWFGLPSMWFTSREAYDDLRLWITYSCKHSNHIVTKIHPEELALFALKPEGAGYVRRTLDDAKLFSIGKWEFFKRDKRGVPKPVQNGEEPEKLGMSFVFFDRASEQFLQPEEDYQSGMMRLLTRTLSDMEDDAAEV